MTKYVNKLICFPLLFFFLVEAVSPDNSYLYKEIVFSSRDLLSPALRTAIPEFEADPALAYTALKAEKILATYGMDISAERLRSILSRGTAHIEAPAAQADRIRRIGDTVYLPYNDRETNKPMEIIYYPAGEKPKEFEKLQPVSNGDSGIEMVIRERKHAAYRPSAIARKNKEKLYHKFARAIFSGETVARAGLMIESDEENLKGLGDDIGLGLSLPEKGFARNFLWNPSCDRREIKARQGMFNSIAGLGEKQFWEFKNGLGEAMELMDAYSDVFDRDNKAAVSMVFSESGGDMEKIREMISDRKNRKKSEAAAVIAKINRLQGAMDRFLDHFSSLGSPLAKAMADIYRRGGYSRFGSPDIAALHDMFSGNAPGGKGRGYYACKSAIDSFVGISVMLKLGFFFRHEKYARAGFNPKKKTGYRGGWNFAAGHKSSQDKIGSVRDSAISIIMTGSNMSGKSHYLAQNLFIQMLGQSTGFIPAEAGNLRIYDNIAYIDRAGTDSTNDLSAFNTEALKWSGPTGEIGKDSILFVDEGFSTTSPDDQRRLLSGVVNLCRERGTRVMLATHNEDLIDDEIGKGDVAVYHFKVELPEEKKKGPRFEDDEDEPVDLGDRPEKIKYTHILAEGRDESHAFAIARDIDDDGILDDFIQKAARFMQGEDVTVVPADRRMKPVTEYSEEDRERMKKETGDFLPFYPHLNALRRVENDSPFGDRVRYEWKYGSRHRGRYDTESDGEEEPESDPLFLLLSKDEDFYKETMEGLSYGILGNDDMFKMVRVLITGGGSSDPAEILERQRMFREIIARKDEFEGYNWRVLDFSNDIRAYLTGLNMDSSKIDSTVKERDILDGFNIYMMKKSYDEIFEYYGGRSNVHLLGLFLGAVRLNMELLGLTMEELGIKGDIDTLVELSRLQERMNAINQDDTKEVDAKAGLELAGIVSRVRSIMAWQLEYDDRFGVYMGSERLLGEAVKNVVSRIYEKTGGISRKEEETGRDLMIREIRSFTGEKGFKKVTILDEKNFDKWEKALGGVQSEVKEASRHSIMFTSDHIKLATALHMLLTDRDPIKELIGHLRSFDSVHLSRIANYYEGIFGNITKGLKGGREFLRGRIRSYKLGDKLDKDWMEWNQARAAKDYVRMMSLTYNHNRKKLRSAKLRIKELEKYESQPDDRWGIARNAAALSKVSREIEAYSLFVKAHEDGFDSVDRASLDGFIESHLSGSYKARLDELRRRSEKRAGIYHCDRNMVIPELDKIVHLFTTAYCMKAGGWNAGTPTQERKIVIKNGWSMVKDKDKQVKNTVEFSVEELLRLLAGSNASGKTFNIKQVIWCLLAFQATGYAPCEGMTAPILDKIMYMDRVTRRDDRTLSSFGNEVKFWIKFFKAVYGGGIVFAGVDEAASTTSPRYQSAFSNAMCEIMLSLGHFMVMASHNYDFVKRFSVANASRTKVYHFKVSVGHDGKPVFEYKIEGGQAPSDGVRVAAMKGLDMVTGKIDGKLLEKKRPEDSVEEMHDALIEADDRKKGQKMIIGVDTSWVPAGQKAIWSYSAIKEALAGTGAWKGLANVKICVSDDPEELRDIMENERATPSGTVPVSDMLIIGPEKSCGRGGIMDVYRSDSPGNGAHFALIGIPAPDADGRDPLESADIDLPGLIAMAINKMSAPGSLKEFTLEIPLAEHLDAGEQTRIYELRLKALVRA